MKINLGIRLELLSPLSIPSEERSSFPSSNDYISGSALRGALASQYLREFEDDDFFKKLFLNNTVFGNLYPVKDNETFLLSSTSVACKRNGIEHGLKDNLWVFAGQELYYREKSSLKNLDKLYRCNHNGCTHDLKPQSGFVYYDENKFKQVRLNKQVHIHTGVNRETGNIQEGIFFSLEEIAAPASFNGTIMVEESLMPDLKIFLDEQVFFLGKNKTRGNGRVKISLLENTIPSKKASEERLNAFNQGFQKYLKNEFGLNRDNFFYFSVDFLSDAILVDKFLRYTFLSEEMRIGNVIYQSVSPVTVKGWSNLWKLPKENETAVKKGSSYLFEIPLEKAESLKKVLNEWEAAGLGLRKEEGFGQLLISSDFHNKYAIRG